MIKHLTAISSLALLSASPVVAQGLAPLIYETDSEWLIDIPSEFGYGSQMSIVDKATGTVRYYESYEFEGDPLEEPSWQTSQARFPKNAPSLSLLAGGYTTDIIVPEPLQNRVSLYGTTGYVNSSGIYPVGVGPEVGLSFPAVPAQGQFDPVILVETGLNSPPTETRHTLFLSSGGGAPYDVPKEYTFSSFARSITFPPAVGKSLDGENAVVVAVVDGGLAIAEPVLDGLNIVNVEGFPEGGQLAYGDFLRTETAHQVLVYAPGDTNLYLYPLSFSGKWILEKPILFDLGVPIQMASRIMYGGKLLAAVHAVGSQEILLFDFVDEKVADRINVQDQGTISAVLSVAGDRIFVLSGDKLSEKYELFGDNGSGTFVSLYDGDVPLDGFGAVADEGRPNIFYFDTSPLDSRSASLLGWESGGSSVDWATDASVASSSVLYRAWSDLGPDQGLQKSFQSSNLLPDGATEPLPNQISDTASLVGLGLTGSSALPLFATWSPSGDRVYDELQAISADFPEGTSLFYRTSAASAWQEYSAPFYPPSDAFTVSYYIETSGGQKGPIEQVDFAFSVAAFNRDSNGDLIPDYVRASLGLDPLGSGDEDDDSASDLDELRARTSLNDGDDTPGEVAGDRGVYQNFQLSAVNVQDRSWKAGSTAFVDRLLGQRLGQATVQEGLTLALIDDLPAVYPEALLAISTESRFFCENDSSDVPTGFENLSIILSNPVDSFDLEVPYSGGSVADAATAWLNALDAYVATSREDVIKTLDESETAFALAFEYALELEFKERGFLTESKYLTLFPNRPGDDRWLTIQEIIDIVDEAKVNSVFDLDALLGDIDMSATYKQAKQVASGWNDWPNFCREIYTRFVGKQIPHTIGRNPVDLLRVLLREQEPSADLVSILELDSNDADGPVGEAKDLRESGFVYETVDTFFLTVIDPASAGCFLTENSFSQSFALFDSSGERFVSSKTVDLLPDTVVRVEGIERSDLDACLGQAIEVHSLVVESLPELSGSDADGNLLDDAWELYWLGPGEYDPFDSIDGSGYSLLQQFLSGSDPNDPADLPVEMVEDLGAPDVSISINSPTSVTLTWDWPGEYSDLIQFKLVQSDSLGNMSAIDPVSVDYSRLSDTHTLDIVVPSGDRRFFRVVLSL